jgi:hypothetical protein
MFDEQPARLGIEHEPPTVLVAAFVDLIERFSQNRHGGIRHVTAFAPSLSRTMPGISTGVQKGKLTRSRGAMRPRFAITFAPKIKGRSATL